MKWISDPDHPHLVMCSKCGYSLSYGKDVCPGCGEKHEPNNAVVAKESAKLDGSKIVHKVSACEIPCGFALVCESMFDKVRTNTVEMYVTAEELREFANGILSVLEKAQNP
jgi:hypothetical protein